MRVCLRRERGLEFGKLMIYNGVDIYAKRRGHAGGSTGLAVRRGCPGGETGLDYLDAVTRHEYEVV